MKNGFQTFIKISWFLNDFSSIVNWRLLNLASIFSTQAHNKFYLSNLDAEF